MIKPAATPHEVDIAAQLANTAFLAAASTDPNTRASWLEAIAASLRVNSRELVELADVESHLGETRLSGELNRTAFQLDLFAEEVRSGLILDATVDHADDSWGMGPRPDIRRVNVPLGAVGVFGASNFPFAFSVIGGDSASALAAGCSVIHKIHSAHRELALRTAEIVVVALESVNAPTGLFQIVDGREAAIALVEHPLIKAVGFTGSTEVGRSLFDRAAARPEPIPFYGELGSINPVFVMPNAWRDRQDEIIDGYAASFTLGMGQLCTKPGVLLVPDTNRENLAERLRAALAKAPTGKMLSPGLRAAFGTSRDAMAGLPGIETLVDGADSEVPEPTVFDTDTASVMSSPEILTREVFGPATVLIRYKDVGELRQLVGHLKGQLTATIQADPSDEAAELVELLCGKSGRVLWNGWPTGVTVSYAQHHGGPYPASTASNTTSVGTSAARRFVRPVAFQGFPDDALPQTLQEKNPWGIARRVNGKLMPAGSLISGV